MRKILIFAFAAAMMLTACHRSAEGVDGNVEDNSPGLFDNKAAQTASSRMSEKLDNSDMSDMSEKSGKSGMSDNSSKSDRDSKSVEVYRSKKMEMPAKMEGTSEILLKREGFFVSYNKELRIPNWVAWHLTAAHTSGDNYRDGQLFTEDNEIPRPRATDSDYYGSTYDRGHMCPSGDNKWSKKAQEESFLFTNVCPQNHELNKGDWNDLAQQCRYWAKRQGDLYIVAGPIFYNGVRNTVGRNKVAVPDAFFKVILADRSKAQAIGFVYPNRAGHKDMTAYVKSIDEIEQLTGIDFFPLLDDRVEDAVEAAGYRKMVDDWQVEKAVDYYNKRAK